MAYCPNCGVQITGAGKFCSNCGVALSSVSSTVSNSAAAQSIPVNTVTTAEEARLRAAQIEAELDVKENAPNYDVVMVDLGSCSKSDAIDMLEDLLGYSTTMAKSMVKNLPTLIGSNMTKKQAVTVAQAFCEYGVDMTLYTPDGPVEMEGKEPIIMDDVYTENSDFTDVALAVLGSLTAANMVSAVNPWNRPIMSGSIMRSPFDMYPTPQHRRRNVSLMDQLLGGGGPGMDPFGGPRRGPGGNRGPGGFGGPGRW